VGVAPLVTTTVSDRTTFSQWRRIGQRGQSPQSTGQQAVGSGGPRIGAGETICLEEIGQKTALTRRGLVVKRLS